MKAEVYKLSITKLVKVPTSLIDLITKVDGLDVGKLKTVPIDLKKIGDVVDYIKLLTTKTKSKKKKKIR